MAIEHTTNEGTNAILVVLLVLVALILGFFLFRGAGGLGGRDAQINVDLPNLQGGTTGGGGGTPTPQPNQ